MINAKFAALTITLVFIFVNATQAREVITLQSGWKFARGHYENASRIDFNDSAWQNVSIPHDWAIEGPVIFDGDGKTGKLPWKGEGWYRNRMMVPAGCSGKHLYLVFDGIMAFPEVYINGTLAGKWDYGYNSFYLDVTGFLQPGKENIIAVHVDTRNHESRWYPGAGIYRKIQLIAVNTIHVGIWGTYVTTPIVKPHYADIRIMTTVHNSSADTREEIKVENSIITPNGKEIAQQSVVKTINPGPTDIEVTITLTHPQRWDIDNPVLYKVKTIIYKGNEIVDTYYTPFGIRTIRFTADNGLTDVCNSKA
jgi:beta-galactosidase